MELVNSNKDEDNEDNDGEDSDGIQLYAYPDHCISIKKREVFGNFYGQRFFLQFQGCGTVLGPEIH